MWPNLLGVVELLVVGIVGYLLGLLERRFSWPRRPAPLPDPEGKPEELPDAPLLDPPLLFDRQSVLRTFHWEDYDADARGMWCVRGHALLEDQQFLASKLLTPDGSEIGEVACCVDHLPPYLLEELDRVQVDL